MTGKGRTLTAACAKREKLAQTRARTAQQALRYTQWKQAQGCSICGYNCCGAALDFHHVDMSTKDHSPKSRDWETAAAVEERKKCILVCANCHRELHHG